MPQKAATTVVLALKSVFKAATTVVLALKSVFKAATTVVLALKSAFKCRDYCGFGIEKRFQVPRLLWF